MKNINPHVSRLLFRLIAFISITVAICMLFSCNPAKKLERAKQTVLLNPQARHEVFLNELERFPCVNDSSTTFAQGGYDSVSLAAYFDFLNGGVLGSTGIYIDSGQSLGIVTPAITPIDSLRWDCADRLTVYYNRGVRDGINSILNKKIPIPRPDTLKTSVRDKQRDKLLSDSINALLRQKAALTASLAQREKDIEVVYKIGIKTAKDWTWLFIAAIAALVLTNGLWIYSRIKLPKLPKL